uniref:C2H2-type domain-containing protein n=1 Tax=Macrostomum lignano TaxID=282301 RepID=A0A1I8II24_9PLAT
IRNRRRLRRPRRQICCLCKTLPLTPPRGRAASATAAAAAANDSASTMSATSTTTTAATKSIVGASSKRAASESLKTELMKEKQLPASEEFHSCQRCPWLGLSHRDLIVHKQGHRTRAATVGKSASETAQQRCPRCGFVASGQAASRAHAAVHKRRYRDRRIQRLLTRQSVAKDADRLLGSVRQLVQLLEKYPAAEFGAVTDLHGMRLPQDLVRLVCRNQSMRSDLMKLAQLVLPV